jgi:hypothetical protein
MFLEQGICDSQSLLNNNNRGQVNNNGNNGNNNNSNNNNSNNNNNESSCFGAATTKLIRSLILVSILSGALVLTYNRCIGCVILIAIFSAITMTCVPLMPLVFMVSAAVLILHAIDYNSATIKVEVPLQNVLYIPTWKDVEQYVHVSPNGIVPG